MGNFEFWTSSWGPPHDEPVWATRQQATTRGGGHFWRGPSKAARQGLVKFSTLPRGIPACSPTPQHQFQLPWKPLKGGKGKFEREGGPLRPPPSFRCEICDAVSKPSKRLCQALEMPSRGPSTRKYGKFRVLDLILGDPLMMSHFGPPDSKRQNEYRAPNSGSEESPAINMGPSLPSHPSRGGGEV